jgi:hypothetical protein
VALKEIDMLIHPWDAALDTAEWQCWLASTAILAAQLADIQPEGRHAAVAVDAIGDWRARRG